MIVYKQELFSNLQSVKLAKIAMFAIEKLILKGYKT